MAGTCDEAVATVDRSVIDRGFFPRWRAHGQKSADRGYPLRLATYRPVAWLALALEIERHGSADEILQGRLINLVASVDVDGAPDIPLEAGVE